MSTTKKKTQFQCGHKGHGKMCHRCGAADKLLGKAKKQRKDGPKRALMFYEVARLKMAPGADIHFSDLSATTGVDEEEAHVILQRVRLVQRERDLDREDSRKKVEAPPVEEVSQPTETQA
jgi:hypothetical protein